MFSDEFPGKKERKHEIRNSKPETKPNAKKQMTKTKTSPPAANQFITCVGIAPCDYPELRRLNGFGQQQVVAFP